MRNDTEYCFGHKERESKMKTVCRRSMPVFESFSEVISEIGDSFSIESAIPLKIQNEDKEQYAYALPYKLESNGSQSIPMRLSGQKYQTKHPVEEESEGIKNRDKNIVLEVKPLRLNKQVDDVNEEMHVTMNGERGEKEANATKLSRKNVSVSDVQLMMKRESNLTKKISTESFSKQEAPKLIFRSKSNNNENVQMKFLKTTYEDPVQCNDVNRMAPVKINPVNVEAVKIKDGK